EQPRIKRSVGSIGSPKTSRVPPQSVSTYISSSLDSRIVPATAFAASTRCTRTTRGPPSLSARRATSQIGPSGHPPPRVPRTTSPRLEIKILKPGLASVDPSVFVTVATANASRRDASSFRRSVYSGVFTERRAPPGAIYLSPDSTGRRREESRHCFGSFCLGLERISRHVSTRIDRGR